MSVVGRGICPILAIHTAVWFCVSCVTGVYASSVSVAHGPLGEGQPLCLATKSGCLPFSFLPPPPPRTLHLVEVGANSSSLALSPSSYALAVLGPLTMKGIAVLCHACVSDLDT